MMTSKKEEDETQRKHPDRAQAFHFRGGLFGDIVRCMLVEVEKQMVRVIFLLHYIASSSFASRPDFLLLLLWLLPGLQ